MSRPIDLIRDHKANSTRPRPRTRRTTPTNGAAEAKDNRPTPLQTLEPRLLLSTTPTLLANSLNDHPTTHAQDISIPIESQTEDWHTATLNPNQVSSYEVIIEDGRVFIDVTIADRSRIRVLDWDTPQLRPDGSFIIEPMVQQHASETSTDYVSFEHRYELADVDTIGVPNDSGFRDFVIHVRSDDQIIKSFNRDTRLATTQIVPANVYFESYIVDGRLKVLTLIDIRQYNYLEVEDWGTPQLIDGTFTVDTRIWNSQYQGPRIFRLNSRFIEHEYDLGPIDNIPSAIQFQFHTWGDLTEEYANPIDHTPRAFTPDPDQTITYRRDENNLIRARMDFHRLQGQPEIGYMKPFDQVPGYFGSNFPLISYSARIREYDLQLFEFPDRILEEDTVSSLEFLVGPGDPESIEFDLKSHGQTIRRVQFHSTDTLWSNYMPDPNTFDIKFLQIDGTPYLDLTFNAPHTGFRFSQPISNPISRYSPYVFTDVLVDRVPDDQTTAPRDHGHVLRFGRTLSLTNFRLESAPTGGAAITPITRRFELPASTQVGDKLTIEMGGQVINTAYVSFDAVPFANTSLFDLASTPNGIIHAIWHNQLNNQLTYATQQGGQWSDALPLNIDFRGGMIDLQLDQKQIPHVAVYSARNADLELLRITHSSTQRQSHSPLFNDDNLTNPLGQNADFNVNHISVHTKRSVGMYPSLAFNNQNQPAITYFHKTNADLIFAQHDGSYWQYTTIDGQNNTTAGRFSNLKRIPDTNRFAVAYVHSQSGHFRYAEQINTNTWQTQTIDTATLGGGYTSLAFTPDNQPAISYYDAHNADLKFAQRTNSQWQTETVAAKRSQGLYSSLHIDPTGKMDIFYYNKSNDALVQSTRQPNTNHWTFSTRVLNGGRAFAVNLPPNNLTNKLTFMYWDTNSANAKVRSGTLPFFT